MGKQWQRTPYVCGSLLVGLWLVAVPGWAGFEEGVRAYKSADYATAVREWLPLAQQGDVRAQTALGFMYYFPRSRGYPPPRDIFHVGCASYHNRSIPSASHTMP
jgi:hypothetical protein